LLTVDFSAQDALLEYIAIAPGYGDLLLILNPGTSGAGNPPSMTSDILTFAPGGLTDWSLIIDFGNNNPGFVSGGNIKNFTSPIINGSVGGSPLPKGQIPEPASMLMAGAGLLAVSGLLRLRKRFHK
jgi:hypothetical protein